MENNRTIAPHFEQRCNLFFDEIKKTIDSLITSNGSTIYELNEPIVMWFFVEGTSAIKMDLITKIETEGGDCDFILYSIDKFYYSSELANSLSALAELGDRLYSEIADNRVS